MITDDKRLFVKELSINYKSFKEQTKESEMIFKNLARRNNLNTSYELSFYAKDMKSFYQNVQSLLSVVDKELNNIINTMKT